MTGPPQDRVPQVSILRPGSRRHLLLIPLTALVAVLPLIRNGCSCGHDFDFHLLNWMEAARQFSTGNLHPHWAYTPAFNAGEPRFVFYPPISWILGALLGLLLTHLPHVSAAAGWNAAPILFTWIALTASGLTLYRLARSFAHANAALLAATLYLANPYMLFTAYERTAYAELLAAAWMPLLFHAILRDKVTIPRIALPVALLWLTNAPAAVIGSYTLALLAAMRLVATYRHETAPGAHHLISASWLTRHRASLLLALNTTAGTALGFCLSAFYLVPAAYQRRFVQVAMATIAGMSIDQNFLFEHTGATPDELLHDQVLHTASIIALILLAATAISLAAASIRRKRSPDTPHVPLIPLALFTSIIAFLLTPPSAVIWNHTPQATFLQFPWRLLAALAPIYALAAGAALSQLALAFTPTAVAALVLAAALTHPAVQFFRQSCDVDDTAPARLALFHSNDGTDPTDEYTPTDADNDTLQPSDPPYWLASSPTAPPPINATPGPAPTHLTLTAPAAEFLILNLRDYPVWRISRNGSPDAAREHREDGLIAVAIPAGPSILDIRYAHTLDQTLGDAITLLALAAFLVLRVKPATQRTH